MSIRLIVAIAHCLFCVASVNSAPIDFGMDWKGERAKGEQVKRVRVLIVADTDAVNIGASVRKDEEQLSWLLSSAFEGSQTELHLTVLRGPDASPDNVREYYRNLPEATGETLFAYYSGHGAWDPNKRHYLAMNAGNLTRQELYDVMQAKKPQFTLIITDCCSSLFPLPVESRALLLHKRVSGKMRVNNVRVRQLLGEHRGTVDINACQYGQVAFGDAKKGGFLTHAFVNACCFHDQKVVAPLCNATEADSNEVERVMTVKPIGQTEEIPLDNDGNGFVPWDEYFCLLLRSNTILGSGDKYQIPRFQWMNFPWSDDDNRQNRHETVGLFIYRDDPWFWWTEKICIP